MTVFNDTHQPRIVNGWTISLRGNTWQAVNKHGNVGIGNIDEKRVLDFAKNNDSNTKLI